MNMSIHTNNSSLICGRNSLLQQLPGFVQQAGDWWRPGSSLNLPINCLCCPVSVPDPEGPSCPSLMSGCMRKSEKNLSCTNACTVTPPDLCLPHEPAFPVSSAAGSGTARKCSKWSCWRDVLFSTRVVALHFKFICQELYHALWSTGRILVTQV